MDYINLTTGFNVAGGSEFKAWIAPCGTGILANEDENQLALETPDVYEE